MRIIMLGFYWICLGEEVIYFNGHFGGCNLWRCWTLLGQTNISSLCEDRKKRWDTSNWPSLGLCLKDSHTLNDPVQGFTAPLVFWEIHAATTKLLESSVIHTWSLKSIGWAVDENIGKSNDGHVLGLVCQWFPSMFHTWILIMEAQMLVSH